MSRVLLVDDEPLLRRTVAMNFSRRGFDVATAGTAAEALQEVAHHPPDVVVLDLGLPDRDGREVIDEVTRSRPGLPVLVLSARTGSRDKVDALDRGAVDYVTKPFDVHELVARVWAALRRSERRPEPANHVGDLRVDVDARAAVRPDGSYLRLTPTEWRLLEVLLAAPGRLVGNRELLLAARGDAAHSDPGYLRSFVGQLRRKLEPDPAHPVHLLTEAGMGYRLRP